MAAAEPGRHGRATATDSAWGGGFGWGGLQLLILLLLQESPRHGYELIEELRAAHRLGSCGRPRRDLPRLTYLDEIGFASVKTNSDEKPVASLDPEHSLSAEARAAQDERC